MFALFIDTSTETKIFCIVNQYGIINSYSYPAISNKANEPFFDWLDTFMGKEKITLSDFTCIAVGYGPGPSFTGIRTGVTLACSLAYASSIPIMGLCSLELYKPAIDLNIFYNIIDARGGELYYVKGQKVLNTFEFTTPKLVSVRSWQDTIMRKDIPIISIQNEFFQKKIDADLNQAVINWDYIIEKIFKKNTYSDPLLFTIPYFKNPR